MWAIRLLTGPQAGQIFNLKPGKNLIGRSPHCDIKVASPGVSKEHSEVVVFSEKIVVTDLRSSNGTFLNGVRIQNAILRLGDKLGIHDVLADVIPAQEEHRLTSMATASQQIGALSTPPVDPGLFAGAQEAAAPAFVPGGIHGFISTFNEYIERVALPGVYRLSHLMELKFVLLAFVGLFIFSTTLLSMIPMVQITKASIVVESKRRASSIARSLATMNQVALLQNSLSALNTNAAETEDGVKQVLIVQQSDGMILAPASRAGTTPDLPFVHSARREMRATTVEVDSTTIGASFPIGLFDPNTGEQSIKAHAIVLYDLGSLAFDDGRAISLFMQTLVLASVLGLIIFYFMYKLIEYPIVQLNIQLDVALREKKDHAEVQFMFPPLQALIGNINSLLTRYIHGESESGAGVFGSSNRYGEAENLTQLIGFPAVTISPEGQIISCNSAFCQVVRADIHQLSGQSIAAISDLSLQKNMTGLMVQARENSRAIHADQLEFSGHMCVISCQAMASNPATVDYYIITVSPKEGGSE